jgi:hypothetical protein
MVVLRGALLSLAVVRGKKKGKRNQDRMKQVDVS